MRTRGSPGFAAILLWSILPLVAMGQVSAQQRRSPSADEQLRQAEGQLLRIAAEHRQAEKAASNRWKWIAGGVIAAGLTAGAVVLVRRRRHAR